MPFASGARVAGGLYHHNYASGGADGGRRLRPHRPRDCGGAGENVIRLANAENISTALCFMQMTNGALCALAVAIFPANPAL